jgi:geranylgeranyl reductase family protein
MTQAPEFDVIVVGAGPAGGSAALRLASTGCRVLLLEKEKLPRYKACGGALVGRALAVLPFPAQELGGVFERRVSCLRLTLDLGAPLTVEHRSPVLALAMRSLLDDAIVRRAVAAGAVLREGVAVQAVLELKNQVRCETTAGSFAASYLIGADGVTGVVASFIRPYEVPRGGVALEGELSLKEDARLDDYVARADFDFNVLPRGYGWVFPKADHLSVGVFTLHERLPQVKRHFDSYLERKGLAASTARLSVRGHMIPIAPRRAPLHSTRILLAGDAAGLADPLTGEGISYALRSGHMAAEAVLAALGTPGGSLNSYTTRLEAELLPELRLAVRLARLLYTAPGFCYSFLAGRPALPGKLLEVFEGRLSYRGLLGKALRKPWKLL